MAALEVVTPLATRNAEVRRNPKLGGRPLAGEALPIPKVEAAETADVDHCWS